MKAFSWVNKDGRLARNADKTVIIGTHDEVLAAVKAQADACVYVMDRKNILEGSLARVEVTTGGAIMLEGPNA